MAATKSVPSEVIEVLRQCTATGNVLVLPAVELPRDLYIATDKHLKRLGGKWRRGVGHVFPSGTDVASLLASTVNTGKTTDEKQATQFFETPEHIASLMCAEAWHGLGSADRVLEPSAGLGAIAKPLRDRFPAADIHVCEQHEGRASELTAAGFHVVARDFLTYAPPFTYDRIVANPPFSGRQDVKHFLRMWDLLSDGGRLVCVLGAGIGYRMGRAEEEVNEIIAAHGDLRDLPPASFRVSGTDVNTVLAVVDKPS